jgi:hypothetical protein
LSAKAPIIRPTPSSQAQNDRARAGLQGHDGDGHAEQQGRHHTEGEAPAVQLEELEDRVAVEQLRRAAVDLLEPEGGPHTEQPHGEGQGEADVQPADALVVASGEPPREARCR